MMMVNRFYIYILFVIGWVSFWSVYNQTGRILMGILMAAGMILLLGITFWNNPLIKWFDEGYKKRNWSLAILVILFIAVFVDTRLADHTDFITYIHEISITTLYALITIVILNVHNQIFGDENGQLHRS